jgi:hypothetical protein
MHPAATLRRWDTLDTVTTSLIAKCINTFATNLKANGVEPAGSRCNIQTVTLSILAYRQTLIGLRKLPNEELRVITAFCGTNFEDDR